MKVNATTAVVAFCRSQGYPLPQTELRFAAPLRRWAFDLAWQPRMLALEIDGGVWTAGRHTRGVGYSNDCEKLAEALIRGWRVLRVTSGQVANGQAFGWLDRLMGKGASA